jgi:hypothetical protein
MRAACIWQFPAIFLALAVVKADDGPTSKPPTRPKPAAAAGDPFGDTSRSQPAKPSREKAKPATKELTVTAAPFDPLLYAYLPLPTPAERKIESALASPTPPIEFVETPLKDVVEYLKDSAHIEIQLDTAGMKDAGIDAEQPVTKNLRGVSLASALNMMLDAMELRWEIHDEILLITTPKRLAEHRTTRLYVVSDIIPAGGKDGKSQDDYSTLIDLISATVAPQSWERKNGSGSIKGATLGGPNVLAYSAPHKLVLEPAPELSGAKVLSVSATYQVHRELAEYLANIRRIHKGGGAAQDSHKTR